MIILWQYFYFLCMKNTKRAIRAFVASTFSRIENVKCASHEKLLEKLLENVLATNAGVALLMFFMYKK